MKKGLYLISNGNYSDDTTAETVFIIEGLANVREAVNEFASRYDVDPDLVVVNKLSEPLDANEY